MAITGRGLVSAAGSGLEPLAAALVEGRSHLGPLPFRGDPAHGEAVGGAVPPGVLGLPAEGPSAGRASRLASLALSQALREGGIAGGLGPPEVGLALGTALGPVEEVEAWAATGAPLAPEMLEAMSFEGFAARLARSAGLEGPRSVFSSTCVSGLCAIEQAAADLALGRCRAVAAGALDTLGPVMHSGFSCLKALSPTGRLQPFDAAHDGIVLGEAASFVLLEPSAAARARGAEIKACLLSQRLVSDGYHFTSPDPSGEAMARAISLALDDAGLAPSDVGCITVTATGSPVHDRMLSRAAEKALGRAAAAGIPVTTWEPAVGHLLAATGIAALVHASWVLGEGRVHPVFAVSALDPECRLAYVLERPVPLSSPVVLSLVVGFGGQNGAIVLSSPTAALDLVPGESPAPAAEGPR